MFGNVHVAVGFFSVRLPNDVAVEVDDVLSQSVGAAFGTENAAFVFVEAAVDLTAERMDFNAVGIVERNAHLIVDIAVSRLFNAESTSAAAPGGFRFAENPECLVERVNVLFEVVVARQPGEVVPVAVLEHHFGVAVMLWTSPKTSGEVGALDFANVANQAVENLIHGGDNAFVITPAQTGNNGQAFFRRFLAAFQEGANASRVYAVGLFKEDVFASFNRRGEMNRAIMRRGCQKDNVAVFNNAFVVIETGENGVLSRLAAGIVLVSIERTHSVFREQVAKSGNDCIFIRFHRVSQRTVSTSAAANQTDAENIGTSRVSAASYGKRTNGSRADGGCLQKITTSSHSKNSFLNNGVGKNIKAIFRPIPLLIIYIVTDS